MNLLLLFIYLFISSLLLLSSGYFVRIMKQYRDSQGKKNKAVSNGGLDDGSLRPGTCSKRRGFHSSNDASEAFRARQRLARLQAPRGSLPPLPLMRGPGREGNRRQMQQLFLQGERTKGGEGGGSDETIQEDRWTPPHASRHLATNGSGNSGTHSLMCDLCQATFLSSTLMEKHFKYSERHALNLKARDESRAVLLRADKVTPFYGACLMLISIL